MMELDLIWKAVLLVVAGTLLLRVAGRKSISQMTLAQTVIMIGIGSLLIQPVSGQDIGTTIGVGAVLVLTLVGVEYLELKSDLFENFITGKAKTIIQDGVVNEANLKKMRLTYDQLEMIFREKHVSTLDDVKCATLESNGQLGFELKEEAQPVTKREFQQLQKSINALLASHTLLQGLSEQAGPQKDHQENLFTEVKNNGHLVPPPERLQ